MTKQTGRRKSLRFSVAVEFIAGIIGVFGIGWLLAGRQKQARALLAVSLLLMLTLGLAPQLLTGDQYADWVTWAIKSVLAALSALALHLTLERSGRDRARSQG